MLNFGENCKFHALKEIIQQISDLKKWFKFFIGYVNHFNHDTAFIY